VNATKNMSANKLLAIDSLGEKISNNFQSGKQPLFGVAFPFIIFIYFQVASIKKRSDPYL